MNVNLGPVLDQFVSDLLQAGHYQTQSEVLREGLRLRKEIAIGSAEADHGEFVDSEEVFSDIRKRSAERKRIRR